MTSGLPNTGISVTVNWSYSPSTTGSTTFTTSPPGNSTSFVVANGTSFTAGDEKWVATGGTTADGTCPAIPATGTAAAPVSTIISVAAGTAYNVNVTLLADAIFTITVTDANGCTSTCTTTVYAEDVRCFAGNSGLHKYTVCHKKTGSTKTHV